MAQAFETTYKRYHRKHDIDRRSLLKPVDRFADILPESGKWLIIQSLEEQKESGLPLTEVENAVKQMYRKRLYSVYQLAYCSKDIPKEEYIQEASENELVKLADELYKRGDPPVLPTRPGARRVFGYLRPAYTYTPLTMYQLVHGKTAYKLLKKGLPPNNSSDSQGGTATESVAKAADVDDSPKKALKDFPAGTISTPKVKSSPGKHELVKEGCRCPCN